MLPNNDLIEILIDQYGMYDVMVFCQIYSDVCSLQAEGDTDDKNYDAEWFLNKHLELKDKITKK